jgi:hypothetical protein
MTSQPLLTDSPIVCTRCMHGHQVEVIVAQGMLHGSVEYHCGCGNYAVVGKETRWPFMVAVKRDKKEPETGIPASVKVDNTGTSPMQTGERIAGKEESMIAPHVKCSKDGCSNAIAASRLCDGHFLEEYGITASQYRENKLFQTESPVKVAARLTDKEKQPGGERTEKPEDETPKKDNSKRPCHYEGCEKKELAGGYCYKHFQVVNGKKYVPGQIRHKSGHIDMPEKKQEKADTPEPATETRRGDEGLPSNIRPVFIPAELYDKLVQLAKAEFRPVDMQAQYLIVKGMVG